MRQGATEKREKLLDEQLQGGEANAILSRLPSFHPGTEGAAPHAVATYGIGLMPHTPEESSAETRRKMGGSAPPPSAPVERDVLNHANFGLLPEEKRKLGSFGISASVNIAIATIIIILTLAQVHQARVHRQETLTYITPPPKPYVPPVPKVKMPPIPVLPKEPPRVQPPKPVIEPPKVHMEVATKAPVMPTPAPRRVITPPKPVLGTFASAHEPAHQATRVAKPETAGFGAPTGVHANPNATSASNLPVVGGFGATANNKQGADSRLGQVASTGFGAGAPAGSPRGSARGTVASTGFGSGTRQAGQPGARGTIASTGFGAGRAPAPAQQVQQTAAATTPIVILTKPLPEYTQEARADHIQGDVTLEVRFTADGQVEVLRVVRGLGHGLDEQARLAAARIRFKPATRGGKAVDQVSIIRVSFELA